MDNWYFPLTCVKQEDVNGCGIAATATVAGVTYARAKAVFFPKKHFDMRDDEELHVGPIEVVAALKKLGFSAKIGKWTSSYKKKKLPAICMLAWQPSRRDSLKHAIVWDPFSKKFIDPGTPVIVPDVISYYQNKIMRSNFAPVIVTGKIR